MECVGCADVMSGPPSSRLTCAKLCCSAAPVKIARKQVYLIFEVKNGLKTMLILNEFPEGAARAVHTVHEGMCVSLHP